MRYLRWAYLCSALLLISASAQAQDVDFTAYMAVHNNLSVGTETFGQVLRVVGLNSSIGASGGGSNPTTVDSNGDVWKSVTTSVNTVDQWTWGSKGTFTDALIVTSSTSYDAATGTTGIYIYKNASTPRVKWETAGTGKSFIMDVDTAGNWRLIRVADSGTADSVPLSVNSNVYVAPYGNYFLPGAPYTVSIGSPGRKFDAFWASNAFFDTLIATQSMATIDGRQLIGHGNIFDENVAPGDTTITVRYNNIANNDYLVAEKNGRREAFKATSGATLINKVVDPSFELGTFGYDVSSGDSVAASTAKAWDGNQSLLVTHGGSTLLQIAQQAAKFTPAVATTYTFCGYFRRDDAAIPVVGDVQFAIGTNAFANMTVEDTQTDGWVRMCGTFTTPNPLTDSRGPYLNWTTTNGASSHDWYVDAFQIETGTKARPYSTSRATYTVTRNLDSTVANQWWAGDSLFDLGGSVGQGWLEGYAESGLGGTSQVGPTWLAQVRTSTSTWNSYEPYAGWGNLNGWWGYGGDTWGFAAGPNSGYHITVETTNGITYWNGASKISQWDTAGNIRIGDFTNGHSSMRLTSTDLVFCANGVLCPLTLKGASGDILGGSATALNTGAGFFLGGASSTFRVGNPSTDYMRWDGSNVTVKSSNLTIDTNGVIIDSTSLSGSPTQTKAFSFNTPTAGKYGMFAYDGGSGNPEVDILAQPTSGLGKGGHVNVAVGSNAGLTYGIFISGTASPQVEIGKIQGGTGTVVQIDGDLIPRDELTGSGNFNLGSSSAAGSRWANIYWSSPQTSGTALWPIVDSAGRLMSKTDGANNGSCPGGQHVSSWVIHFGIVISFTCS